MRYLVLIGAMMLTASPAFACYTVKFENKSDATVGVGWKAGGCLKVWQNFAVVCTHHVIGPGLIGGETAAQPGLVIVEFAVNGVAGL